MCQLFDGEPGDQAERTGMPRDEGPAPAIPLARGELGGGVGAPAPCLGQPAAEDAGLICGSGGASRGLAGAVGQGLWGRLLLKTRQKVLGGVGALQRETLPVGQLGSGRAQRQGDGDPPLTGPRMGFAHVGLNSFLHDVALHPGKKWIPRFYSSTREGWT